MSKKEKPIEFPDDILRKVFMNAAGKIVGKVYLSDIKGIKKLEVKADCSRLDVRKYENKDGYLAPGLIENLAGIENCDHLVEIILKNHSIRKLNPLRRLSALQKLNLENNAVKNLSPLSGCMNLRTLNLSKNFISDISPLSDLKNLQYLSLWHNNVTSIDSMTFLVSVLL